MITETLKQRMEYYRDLSDTRLLPNSWYLVMIDGHSFSKKVKNRFKKPFDPVFIGYMNETARWICKKFPGILLAYTQSDEISFILHDTPESDPLFNLRTCKILSLIASEAAGYFSLLVAHDLMSVPMSDQDKEQAWKDQLSEPYTFDCKFWTVPCRDDAEAWIIYRQNDCIRNSIQQAAQTYLSHKSLLGKTTEEAKEMLLKEKGISWDTEYDDGMKYGRLIYRVPRQDYPGRSEYGVFGATKISGTTILTDIIDGALQKSYRD